MAQPRRTRRRNIVIRDENRDSVRTRKRYDSASREVVATDQTVTDDWPSNVPITAAEVDVLEIFLGELLDAFLRPRH